MITLKLLLIACIAIITTGCKLTIIANEGGSVASQSGLYDCAKKTICPITITSPSFSETFQAQPEPGYQFVNWQERDWFIGGCSTNPN